MKHSKRILFICGSMNQTTMMMKIAEHLSAYDCWFTPHYTDGLIGRLEKHGMLEWTIVGKCHQHRALETLMGSGLQIDVAGRKHSYDLVITCSDLFVPKNIRHTKVVLVQEGMTDPENLMFHLVRSLRLPRYLASTSTFGLSDVYDRMCVASEGYKNLFVRKGVRENKIVVTGIPNFDQCAAFLATPPVEHNYVLVATSDARETFKYENRRKTIEHAQEIAGGRQLVFKIHPNERLDRAIAEIKRYAPNAKIYHDCDINPLIAHCDVLITKYSTSAFVGIALGKEVYSDFSMTQLRELCPQQNNGTSAQAIAEVCEDVLKPRTCAVYSIDDVRVDRRAS